MIGEKIMNKWYGSLQNRLAENHVYSDEITVGTGVTEYGYSDRYPYEVVEVKDQKHVVVRGLDHKHVGKGCMDNIWELVSNPNNPCRTLERRGDTWYWTNTVTKDDIADIDLPQNMELKIRLAVAGYDIEKIREKGKQTKRYKANVSFGFAVYYYDYSF